jgi:DNA-binding beta-propeller fold protein YncE
LPQNLIEPTSDELLQPEPADLHVISEAERRRLRLWGEGRLRRLSFPLFVSFWAIYIFIAYTLAGEKMPWLATHLTLPMIFLTAWVFRRFFDNVDWVKFRQGGWIYLLLLPLLGIALAQLLAPFAFDQWQSLFSGLQTVDQQTRNLWFAMIAIVIVVCFLIYQVSRRVGWKQFRSMIAVATFGILALLTARTAWTAAYINYDYATEYMVYAHAAPGIRTMMEQIDELSRRTAGEMNLDFAWGGNSWPVTWYFRDLTNATFFGGNPTPEYLDGSVAVYASEDIRSRVEPLLGDDYYRFEYMRMWWPSWNYYNLNATRMNEAWDFSPENTRAGQIREGLWDIWWNRDYSTYGNAMGEDYALTNWNPGERLYFYVRKDVASQIWNLGLGEGTVLNPLTASTPNICVENWQPISANFALDSLGQNPIALNHPLDIVTADDGHIFVADENNARIVEYDDVGNYVRDYTGATGGLAFNRPNGVALGADGSVWIADTWNYRVGEFTRDDGAWLNGWGQPGLFGDTAESVPTDGFWGPRDIAVDADGNVYVSDTGNKRIRVYNAAGEWLRDIGSSGSELGQLNEPAGIAVGSDRLYVADTWNQRVSVFALDGTPMYTFDVRGWFEDLGNRPYLALDEVRNMLYVTDPDAGRVLVYDMQGNCVGSFGEPSDAPFNLNQFDVTSGVTVDNLGNVYVVDSGANRILQFPPFPASTAALEDDALNQALFDQGVVAVEAIPAVEETGDISVEITVEITSEVVIEATSELTLEITPEATPAE